MIKIEAAITDAGATPEVNGDEGSPAVQARGPTTADMPPRIGATGRSKT